jgi:very-short-patch-repair endonuclease
MRTAVDLLRLSPPFIGLAAADAFTRAGLVQLDRLTDALEPWAGFRGVATARRLAALTEPLAESAGESWLRLRFADAGLPRPTAQIPVGGDGNSARFRLDLGWPQRKVAAEYDGEEYHAQADSSHDLERRRVIESVFGWTVIVARKEDVLGRSMLLEHTACGLLGMEPANSRRTW